MRKKKVKHFKRLEKTHKDWEKILRKYFTRNGTKDVCSDYCKGRWEWEGWNKHEDVNCVSEFGRKESELKRARKKKYSAFSLRVDGLKQAKKKQNLCKISLSLANSS